MPSPNLDPLRIQQPSDLNNPFSLIGRLHLPVAIQKSVYATVAANDLYLWINGPDGGETNPLRITDDHRVEQLPQLDFMIGGATYCQNQFVLTGIDENSQPIILGLDHDGMEIWRYRLEGPTPTVWQQPYCIGETWLVWQTSPQELHVAQAQDDGLYDHQTINMTAPPTSIASDKQSIYAFGASDEGLEGVKISKAGIQPIQIKMPYPSNLTASGVNGKFYIAWTRKKMAYVAQLLDNTINPSWELALDQASTGKITLIAGDIPVLWSQYNEYDGNNINQWLSMIYNPQHDPLQISGLVQNIIWWGKTLVVTGSVDTLLFK